MILSMTGFGKSTITRESCELTAEIKSLNNRHLDIIVRAPRFLSYMEDSMRKLVQSKLSRGKIELYITYNNFGTVPFLTEVNLPLARAYYECFEKLSIDLKLQNTITTKDFANIPDMISLRKADEKTEHIQDMAIEVIELALENLKSMRANEGSGLKDAIVGNLDKIEQSLQTIDGRAPFIIEEYRQKLCDRIKIALNGAEPDENRLYSEIAYFADRTDITEEIVRLTSHIIQFKNILDTGGAIGRKLDFMLQEVNREINTIGSKSSDIDISNLVISMKSEAEKIREQIQNIE